MSRFALLLLTLAACAPQGDDQDLISEPVCFDPVVPHCTEERTAFDNDGDGVAETAYTEVRANGVVVEARLDNDADGTDDNVGYYTFDAKGRPLTSSYDFDGDGDIDNVDTEVWDDSPTITTHYVDDSSDGVVERYEELIPDGEGRTVEIRVDILFDGVVDELTRYEYGEGDLVTARRYDNGADGSYQAVERWEYDDQGRVTLHSEDFGDDGRDDWTVTTYDADCDRPVTIVQANANGTVRRTDYTYDAQGRPETAVEDDYADTRPERMRTWTWTDSTEEMTFTNLEDGVDYLRIEHDLDADGRVIAERYDQDADGDVESFWTLDAVCDV